jgi:hypothetical protein
LESHGLFYAERVKALSVVLLTSVVVISSWAQVPSSQLPRFGDYEIKERFKGTPVVPMIETSLQRMYRTRIREGVTKGWGVRRQLFLRIDDNYFSLSTTTTFCFLSGAERRRVFFV